jgi:hypothetical protein
MAYAYPGEGALDYYPCRYGKSKILFRGPRRDLEQPFVAVLGGTETYGKFLPLPYPALTEEATGIRMVNLGCVNAGLDVYLNEPVIPDILGRARVTVIQLMGAQNMSNRYYAVHPRRNDRFLRASGLLRTIYREVDFTEFNFTRHMLTTLQSISPQKFEVVVDELKAAWVARMSLLLDQARGKTVLLWMADRPPSATVAPGGSDAGPVAGGQFHDHGHPQQGLRLSGGGDRGPSRQPAGRHGLFRAGGRGGCQYSRPRRAP